MWVCEIRYEKIGRAYLEKIFGGNFDFFIVVVLVHSAFNEATECIRAQRQVILANKLRSQ